jgi:predicted transcriptional regulator
VELALTERELDVMAVLWERGSGTVAEVRDALADGGAPGGAKLDLAYTTVLTILRTMEEKGYVRHEAEGKAHRYFPAVQQQAVRKSALARLVDTLFRGSPELVLTQLVSDRGLSNDEIARLRQLLDERTDRDAPAPSPKRAPSKRGRR